MLLLLVQLVLKCRSLAAFCGMGRAASVGAGFGLVEEKFFLGLAGLLAAGAGAGAVFGLAVLG